MIETRERAELLAIVVGHSSNRVGARNENYNTDEFHFNQKLARLIAPEIDKRTGFSSRIVYRENYRDLPNRLNNDIQPDFILSLHCNAYNRQASGSEMLYYEGSRLGERAAEILQGHIVEALGLRDRGVKPRDEEDRGGFLLKNTLAPCVIAEPFFIDNDNDLGIALANLDKLVEAYVEGVFGFMRGLRKARRLGA